MQKIFAAPGKKRATQKLKISLIIQTSLNPIVEHNLMLA
jgi:hypothetical protein